MFTFSKFVRAYPKFFNRVSVDNILQLSLEEFISVRHYFRVKRSSKLPIAPFGLIDLLVDRILKIEIKENY